MKKILIIAGETSSDMHAANLVRDIKSLDKNIGFFGLGGDRMQDAGVELLYNIVHMAFIGPGGLFKHYAKLKKIYNSLCEYINKNTPDCAILIDFAEFNLRVAKNLKKLGVPVIYYISPQVWAWGAWRINTIKKFVDKMLVFFKFEEELYRSRGIDVTFVGHPLLDSVKPARNKEDIIKELRIDNGAAVVGVLPGSRENEVNNILPIMLDSCKLLLKKTAGLKIEFVLPLAPSIEERCIKEIIDRNSINIKIIKSSTYDALAICDAAMVASGTATLETALMGVPMAIIYRVNLLTYLMARNVIRLPYIGIVNVIAGRKIVEEFLQQEARPECISDYILRLLEDRKLSNSIKEKFVDIRKLLGESGASKRAAKEVVSFLCGLSKPLQLRAGLI